mgnify:CR=1 FL=1
MTALVKALRHQAHNMDIEHEIIIYDDASTPSEFQSIYNDIDTFEHCRCIRGQENKGRTFARNLLANNARYDTLLFLDADVLPLKKTFLKDYLACAKKTTVVCGGGDYEEKLKDKEHVLRWAYGKKREARSVHERNKAFLNNAIFKSCKIKSNIVSKDEKEKDLRMILNFGHTFAHGFESAKNFSKKLNHGEAVLLGMMLASELSNKKKQLSFRELLLIKKHYLSLKLPMNINKIFKKKEISKIVHFMKKDKKNVDEKINLILLNKIGKTTQPKEFSLKSDEIRNFLNSYFL